MFSIVFALILVGIGFVSGYGVRASISRNRRAFAREEWLVRRDQKRYDDGLALNSRGIAFSVPDEALEAAANADRLAQLRQLQRESRSARGQANPGELRYVHPKRI